MRIVRVHSSPYYSAASHTSWFGLFKYLYVSIIFSKNPFQLLVFPSPDRPFRMCKEWDSIVHSKKKDTTSICKPIHASIHCSDRRYITSHYILKTQTRWSFKIKRRMMDNKGRKTRFLFSPSHWTTKHGTNRQRHWKYPAGSQYFWQSLLCYRFSVCHW